MRRSITTIALLIAAAAALGGCGQTAGLMGAVEDVNFKAPDFSLPDFSFGKSDDAQKNFDLGPNGPVAATDLISPTGYCAPSAEPAPAPQAAAPPPQAAAAPPPDQLEPEGLGPAVQAPVLGGVALGMSECAVARRLGTPGNVSISAGPKGQRRVVLTYLQGERPGLYSFQSGRLIQVDATPQQAAKYDKGVKKKQTRRTRGNVERMYVQ